MPFQPLPDSGPGKPAASDFALLLIRLLTTALFFYYQLADQLRQSKQHIWNKADWDLANQLAEKGLHYSGAVASAMIIGLALGFLGILLGIFTRINALALLLIAGFAFIAPLELSSALTPQSLALYLTVFFALTCGGAGRISLDYILAGKKADHKSA